MTMTDGTAAQIEKPEDFGSNPSLRRAQRLEAERNHEFFMAHVDELFEQYPEHWLLIHSGDKVEPFDDLVKLMDRFNSFDPVTRGGALRHRRQTGNWIL